MRMKSVLVSGAGGFIGRAVTSQLAAMSVPEIRAGLRYPDSCAAQPNTVSIQCDALDESSLRRALQGVDTVFQCARDDAPGATLRQAQATLAIGRELGVRKVVLFSSIAAFGAVSGVVNDETEPVEPISPYGREKLEVEKLAKEVGEQGLSVTVLRPALVYGPNGREWSLHFTDAIKRGRLADLLASGEGTANLIHVNDVADFAISCAEAKRQGYECFIVNGPDTPSFNAYFALMNELSGHGKLTPRISPRPLRSLARQARRAARKISKGVLPNGSSINKALSWRFGDESDSAYAVEVYFDPVRARTAGFKPRISLREGVESVLKSEGMLR